MPCIAECQIHQEPYIPGLLRTQDTKVGSSKLQEILVLHKKAHERQ